MIFEIILQTRTGVLGEAVQIAITTISDPFNFLLLLLATLLGLLMGAIPGMGGPITLVLLIPVTFAMDANIAILVMTAALGGSNFGGSITAILFNTPGAAPNAATLFDGYPMTQQGRAGEAVAASATASACGAIIGVVLLVIFFPVILPFALAFGPPEFFWLAIMGLAVIAVATTGSILSDLAAGGFGLMLAFHGLSPVTGAVRYTWGIDYLFDGIQLISVIIGLFAIAEMASLASRGVTISEKAVVAAGRLKGIKAVLINWKIFLRSAVLGWLIGLIPGVGGVTANFLAYLQAKKGAPDPDSFGKGNVVGVIASEASNDAKSGGALLPTLTLGIPGSASTAVLLAAFVLHGATPGPILLEENLQFVFIVIFALVISNIVTSSVGLLLTNYIAQISRISMMTLAPVIIVVSLLTAFVVRGSFGDVLLAFVFGAIGFIMIKHGVSRVALLIGLILGPIAENNFHQAIQISRGDFSIFFTRPTSFVLFVVTVAVLLVPIIQYFRDNQ